MVERLARPLLWQHTRSRARHGRGVQLLVKPGARPRRGAGATGGNTSMVAGATPPQDGSALILSTFAELNISARSGQPTDWRWPRRGDPVPSPRRRAGRGHALPLTLGAAAAPLAGWPRPTPARRYCVWHDARGWSRSRSGAAGRVAPAMGSLRSRRIIAATTSTSCWSGGRHDQGDAGDVALSPGDLDRAVARSTCAIRTRAGAAAAAAGRDAKRSRVSRSFRKASSTR